jgi:hypothetical protein
MILVCKNINKLSKLLPFNSPRITFHLLPVSVFQDGRLCARGEGSHGIVRFSRRRRPMQGLEFNYKCFSFVYFPWAHDSLNDLMKRLMMYTSTFTAVLFTIYVCARNYNLIYPIHARIYHPCVFYFRVLRIPCARYSRSLAVIGWLWSALSSPCEASASEGDLWSNSRLE